jgi:hypothetical protein
MGGQQPGKICRIGDAGVHAVAGIGNPDVSRVAGDEDASVAKPVGHQPAAVPVLFRNDLVTEIRTDTENGPDRPVAIDGIEILFVRSQVVVHEPAFASVDRIDHAGAARIDRAGPPRGRVLLAIDQIRRPNVGRLNALNHRVALQLRPDRLANDGPGAVAPDHVAEFWAMRRLGFEVAERRRRAVVRDLDILGSRPVEDLDARLALGVDEQDRLEENLIDAMGRFRCRPIAVGARRVDKPVAPVKVVR